MLFISPWLVSLVVFTAYPVLGTFYLAFTDYNILEPPVWVGTKNFERMLYTDRDFWIALRNSTFYSIISVPLKLALAMAIAVLMNAAVRGIGFYRVLFYLPALVPPVAATMAFILLFTPNAGPVNVLIQTLGVAAPNWLSDPSWAIWMLIVMALWPLGIETLVFLAALQEVPSDLIDAAKMDGAGAVQRFFRIIVPLLTPAILFNLVVGIIQSFQVFTKALVIGGTTGEPQNSTLMFLVLIYRSAFRYFEMGYASALSVALFFIILALTALVFSTSTKWTHYQGGRS